MLAALALAVPGPLPAQESMDDLFDAADEPADAAPATEEAAEADSVEDLFEDTAEPAAGTAAPAEGAGEAGSLDDLFEAAPDAVAGSAAEPAEEKAPAVRASGFFQNEFAYTTPDESHFSKFRNILKLRLNGSLSPRVKWQLGGHIEYDPVFEFDDCLFVGGHIRQRRRRRNRWGDGDRRSDRS